MSFEIRSPSDPGSEPPKSDFYVTLDVLRRIYNFFRHVFVLESCEPEIFSSEQKSHRSSTKTYRLRPGRPLC